MKSQLLVNEAVPREPPTQAVPLLRTSISLCSICIIRFGLDWLFFLRERKRKLNDLTLFFFFFFLFFLLVYSRTELSSTCCRFYCPSHAPSKCCMYLFAKGVFCLVRMIICLIRIQKPSCYKFNALMKDGGGAPPQAKSSVINLRSSANQKK